MARHGTAQRSTLRHGTAQHVAARHGTAQQRWKGRNMSKVCDMTLLTGSDTRYSTLHSSQGRDEAILLQDWPVCCCADAKACSVGALGDWQGAVAIAVVAMLPPTIHAGPQRPWLSAQNQGASQGDYVPYGNPGCETTSPPSPCTSAVLTASYPLARVYCALTLVQLDRTLCIPENFT